MPASVQEAFEKAIGFQRTSTPALRFSGERLAGKSIPHPLPEAKDSVRQLDEGGHLVRGEGLVVYSGHIEVSHGGGTR